MIVLAYIGNHRKDGITARIGWGLVRLAQIGAKYRRVTHVESLLVGPWHSASIASSSLREGGVRIKRDVRLTPGHWIAIDVPAWDTEDAIDWFAEHEGQPYDWRGALATALWFLPHGVRSWFCNEAVAAPHGVVDGHRLTPAAFIALALSMPGSRVITEEFFNGTTTTV